MFRKNGKCFNFSISQLPHILIHAIIPFYLTYPWQFYFKIVKTKSCRNEEEMSNENKRCLKSANSVALLQQYTVHSTPYTKYTQNSFSRISLISLYNMNVEFVIIIMFPWHTNMFLLNKSIESFTQSKTRIKDGLINRKQFGALLVN